jgi:hypothetical protein
MSQDLRAASVEAVGWWLFGGAGAGGDTAELGAYVSSFRKYGIDGSALAGLSDEELSTRLKVTDTSHRRTILAARDALLAQNVVAKVAKRR